MQDILLACDGYGDLVLFEFDGATGDSIAPSGHVNDEWEFGDGAFSGEEATITWPAVVFNYRNPPAAKWRTVVENLGNLPKLALPSEVEAARRSLQSLLGIVRVDRQGKGYADLSIGVPTGMVAGAGFGTLQVVFNLAA